MFTETDRLINQAVISRVTIAVEKLSHRRRRKQRDASTNRSNNFGVSHKHFKPSTPGSVWSRKLIAVVYGVRASLGMESGRGNFRMA